MLNHLHAHYNIFPNIQRKPFIIGHLIVIPKKTSCNPSTAATQMYKRITSFRIINQSLFHPFRQQVFFSLPLPSWKGDLVPLWPSQCSKLPAFPSTPADSKGLDTAEVHLNAFRMPEAMVLDLNPGSAPC